jgi:lysozyme
MTKKRNNKPTKRNKKNNNKPLIFVVIIIALAFLFYRVSMPGNKRKISLLFNNMSVYFEQTNFLTLYSKNFGIEIPKGYNIHGIDVCHYQRKINWEEVAKERQDNLKIYFAFIKATEGKTHVDRYFDYNLSEARKNNIPCGVYHYYKPHVNSAEQAQNFINTVKLKPGDLPPVLDIEEESLLGNENMIKGIKNWLEIIENHYDMTPIIYTGNDFHRRFLKGKKFEKYPFWIAHYYKRKIRTSSKWIFWQHNDKARVNGIEGYVDMNVFNGNIDELKKLCKKN